ncbi:hypothetical protein H4Q26_009636 [Puccinia striiformis f. sp. tritici PST-130]|nr:hypothetical protein H4Q26_009636 [Puccinia striiformis f. sp. tritici PST-130]
MNAMYRNILLFFTNIGDSERPGGEAVWCQDSNSKTSPSAGVFNGKFWTDVEISTPKDGVIQMTGCINVNTCDRLNPNDAGGQYDSNGGADGRGNPANSYCANYHTYVQLIEPAGNRACIRCCQNAADCNLSNDERAVLLSSQGTTSPAADSICRCPILSFVIFASCNSRLHLPTNWNARL